MLYTDNKMIEGNFDNCRVQNNIEAEMWEGMRHKWATRIVWHRRTELRQREAYNAAGEASEQ